MGLQVLPFRGFGTTNFINDTEFNKMNFSLVTFVLLVCTQRLFIQDINHLQRIYYHLWLLWRVSCYGSSSLAYINMGYCCANIYFHTINRQTTKVLFNTIFLVCILLELRLAILGCIAINLYHIQ